MVQMWSLGGDLQLQVFSGALSLPVGLFKLYNIISINKPFNGGKQICQ